MKQNETRVSQCSIGVTNSNSTTDTNRKFDRIQFSSSRFVNPIIRIYAEITHTLCRFCAEAALRRGLLIRWKMFRSTKRCLFCASPLAYVLPDEADISITLFILFSSFTLLK